MFLLFVLSLLILSLRYYYSFVPENSRVSVFTLSPFIYFGFYNLCSFDCFL